MRQRSIGWAFVGAQAVLLVALVVLPERSDWPTPAPVELVGLLAVVVGIGIVVFAGRGLGQALTPTPVPKAGAPLATGGAYRLVRHPIYSGVLLVVAGLVVGSGSVITAIVGAGTWSFFHAKAAWEERQLSAVHPDYGAYAQATPRFVPRGRRRRRS